MQTKEFITLTRLVRRSSLLPDNPSVRTVLGAEIRRWQKAYWAIDMVLTRRKARGEQAPDTSPDGLRAA